MKILILPGDGIGPEIIAQAIKVLVRVKARFNLALTWEEALIGGAAYDSEGDPLPADTLEHAQAVDAVLLGAVGGPKWASLERHHRPESGLLRIRSGLGLFANLRPAIVYPELASASTLKRSVVAGLDILIVRELTGGIYFGQPRGIRHLECEEREGFNTLTYRESEIERIAHVAFESALLRNRTLCSVDKANVLESSELWRETVTRVSQEYPAVELSHMYVDNAAMQLVREPRQFDVIVTGNLFGDILSDEAAMLTGSIGMLPSASMNKDRFGLFEPIHGSAPDIAGQDKANPLATVLSLAMLFRYALDLPSVADHVEQAVKQCLHAGILSADLGGSAGTSEIGDKLVEILSG